MVRSECGILRGELCSALMRGSKQKRLVEGHPGDDFVGFFSSFQAIAKCEVLA